jgi:hypothetical protein
MSGSNSSDPAASPVAADPMALTVHSVPLPEVAAPSRRRGRITMLLVLLACAAPVIVSYFMFYVVRPDARNNYAELIQPTRSLPADLALTDLNGQSLPASALKGQWLLVVVAGSDCDARCEALLLQQRQVREMTGRDRDRIDKLWLVTDTGPIRAPLQQAMAAAPPTTVLRVPAQALQAWLQAAPGQGLADHLYVVDPMGEWMMRTPPQPDPMKFKKDLERLLRASAFWDRAGRTP